MELKEFDKKRYFKSITGIVDNAMAANIFEYFSNLLTEDNSINRANEHNIKSVYPHLGNDFKLECKPDLYLNLNCPGGGVYYGLSIHDIIRRFSEYYNIHFICNGLVASAATFILMSIPLENRICTENTTFIIHQVSSISVGTTKDIEDDAAECKRLTDLTFNILLDNTKITEEELKEVYEKKRDWIITSNEALKLGIVNKII